MHLVKHRILMFHSRTFRFSFGGGLLLTASLVPDSLTVPLMPLSCFTIPLTRLNFLGPPAMLLAWLTTPLIEDLYGFATLLVSLVTLLALLGVFCVLGVDVAVRLWVTVLPVASPLRIADLAGLLIGTLRLAVEVTACLVVRGVARVPLIRPAVGFGVV